MSFRNQISALSWISILLHHLFIFSLLYLLLPIESTNAQNETNPTPIVRGELLQNDTTNVNETDAQPAVILDPLWIGNHLFFFHPSSAFLATFIFYLPSSSSPPSPFFNMPFFSLSDPRFRSDTVLLLLLPFSSSPQYSISS